MARIAFKQRFIIFGLIGIFLLVSLLGASQDKTTGSSYQSNSRGTRAFKLFLEGEDQRVETWLFPFNKLNLEDLGNVLLVIEPETIHYHEQLRQWIERGNTVLYFGNLRSLGKAESDQNDEVENLASAVKGYFNPDSKIDVHCTALNPEVCTQVKTVSIGANSIGSSASGRSIIGDTGRSYVTFQALGKGAIWNFADSSMITNQNIDKYDNLRFLYQLVTSGNKILFDEFHHGYSAPTSAEVQGRKDSIYLLAGYIAFALLVIALTQSFRFGPPLVAVQAEGTNSTEYTSAQGLLYSEYEAVGVLEHYLIAWKERVEQRYGLSQRLDYGQILDALQERLSLKPELARSLKESISLIGTNSSSVSETALTVRQLESILGTNV